MLITERKEERGGGAVMTVEEDGGSSELDGGPSFSPRTAIIDYIEELVSGTHRSLSS